MGKKATQILTTASSTPTLFCLKDKLLSGGADDLISTFQPNAVEPSNGILNSWVSSSEKEERKKKNEKRKVLSILVTGLLQARVPVYRIPHDIRAARNLT